ncbi:hypothetical protein [Viridibacillus sp. FSL H8-0123]|uniref:hypothetical protein n=1 Tax=Viridibacillus sp. FSL H8-0123 TaxID=1928922 RepID=UPI00096C3C6C|nr:hypothetical protein [Viridibacillus sp. FSL H8-0123]OMC78451.1 hypothetical protein BK130_19885 [Viridibacillus sp. FSL H8-0123]
MKKTFLEICNDEGITIPTTLLAAKRIQRFSPDYSVDFTLDKESIELLESQLPLKCNYTLLKKMAENIIVANREKYRKNDISRLELMRLPQYRYHNASFYYSII